MLPQFNTFWFASQLFWFGVSFSGFLILSSKLIVPIITGYFEERNLVVKKIMKDADNILAEAGAIRNRIEQKMQLAKNEAGAILHKAKVECENNNSNFNQMAASEIEKYKKIKTEELDRELLKRRSYFLSSIDLFSASIAKKSGIDGFVMNKKIASKVESNLKI